MPNIGFLHPQVVHFVIALLFVGVIARVVSLLRLPKALDFAGPMAALLILLGAGASLVAVESGTDAHDAVERVPGLRSAVMDHEEWGERTRNIFLVVAGIELVALALRARPAAKVARAASALLGLAGLFSVYRTGDLGGDIVYNYAGGVGIRSGDTSDVRHLMIAALYENAMLERNAGRGDTAYALFEELVRRHPESATHFLRVQSLIRDKKDPRAALAALNAWVPPANDERLTVSHGLLVIEAYQAAGMADSARAKIASLRERFPQNRRLQAMLQQTAGAGRPQPPR
jgi:uncharacterized membrane protein